MAVAAIALLALSLGPWRPQVGARLTSLRKRIVPKPSYIEGEQASVGAQLVPALTDKTNGPGAPTEFVSDQLSSNPPTTPPSFTVRLGKDSDLTRPIGLFKVGLDTGINGGDPTKYLAPHHVVLIARDAGGNPEKEKTFTLRQDTKFQSFLFRVSHVSSVDVYVVDTYKGQGMYVIDEVEFFTLS
jgi:hypothetical protein